jgi:hypothetical protein
MPAYAAAKYEESQANSSSRLKTWELHRHNSAELVVIRKFKTRYLGTITTLVKTSGSRGVYLSQGSGLSISGSTSGSKGVYLSQVRGLSGEKLKVAKENMLP